MADRGRSPVGVLGHVTRGTTNPNRLRRFDRWYCRTQAARLRAAVQPPLLVDLGYGRTPVTAVELLERAAVVRHDVTVVGVEIDPERVRLAREAVRRPGLDFVHAGFDLAPLGERRALLVRAFNVLRQYEEAEVPQAWRAMTARLAPGGIAVDGTCDELGRLACWVVLDADGPRRLVLGYRLAGLQRPGSVAARLPKALIHHNVAPQPVHTFLQALDAAWAHEAPLAAYGARQRFVASCRRLSADGWPLREDPTGWRQGLVEVAWSAVDPAVGPPGVGPGARGPHPD